MVEVSYIAFIGMKNDVFKELKDTVGLVRADLFPNFPSHLLLQIIFA